MSKFPAVSNCCPLPQINHRQINLVNRTALLCFLLLPLIGCIPKQSKDISIYRQTIDNNEPAKVAPFDTNRVLTLADAVKLANQNEERLSIQGENYLQELITKDRTFSNFLPQISLSPAWNFNSAAGKKSGNHGPYQQVSADANGSWSLFNGFRDYNSMKAEDMTIEQQRQLTLDLQQTVLLDVATAYYQVLTSEQSVDVLNNSVKVQQANVNFILAHQRAGTAIQLDVAQAEAQLSQTQVSLNQSTADVRNGRSVLAFLVDEPVQENPLRDNFSPPDQIDYLNVWLEQAEANRQDLKAADAAVSAARDQVEVAFGEYYPTLTLNLNYILYNIAYQPGTYWQGALNMNLPIFTGGAIRADVRAAWSAFRVAALQESELRRSIDENVAIAYENLDLARRQLRELEVQVKAARDELYLAQAQYKNGSGLYLNVLQATNTLITTQLQLTTAQFQQKTAYFNLLRSVGGLTFANLQAPSRPTVQHLREQRLRELATQPVTQPSSRPGVYR